MGLITPDKGQILLNGKDINKTNREKFFWHVIPGWRAFDSHNLAKCCFQAVARVKTTTYEARKLAIEKRRVGLQPEVADKYPAGYPVAA